MNKEERERISRQAEMECNRTLSQRDLSAYFRLNIRKNRLAHYRKLYKEVCRKNKYTARLWNVFSEQYGDGYDFGEFKKGRIVKIRENGEKVLIKDINEDRGVFMKLIDKAASVLINEDKDFVLRDFPDIEKFLNLIAYVSSFFVTWSDYLIYYAPGRRIIDDLFHKPSITSFINLYVIIIAIKISGDYDNVLFKENFMKLLPYVLPVNILSELGIITTETAGMIQSHYIGKLAQKQFVNRILVILATYLERKIREGGYWEYTKNIIQQLYYRS